MIESIDQSTRPRVQKWKFGWMEITGRGIDAQRVDCSGGGDSFGRAN